MRLRITVMAGAILGLLAAVLAAGMMDLFNLGDDWLSGESYLD
jgi:hypothetical protein